MGTLQDILKERGFEDVDEFLNLTDKLIVAKGEEAFVDWKVKDGTKEGLMELLK